MKSAILFPFLLAPFMLGAEVIPKPITEHPCLLFDASDVPRVRRTVETLEAAFPGDFRRPDSALIGMIRDDPEARRRATAGFLSEVRTHLGGDVVAKFGPDNNPYSPLRRMRRLNELIYEYDVVVSFGLLSESEKREFREDAVRAVKFLLGADPKRFPSPESPSTNGLENPEGYSTCNRWADQFSGAVELGLLFPDEPLAKDWVNYGLGQIQYMLDHGDWDGAWNEVPRYHDTTLRIFLPLFLALQRRAGVDFFQHPHLKPLLEWYVRFSSPLVRFPETSRRNPAGERSSADADTRWTRQSLTR